MRITASLNLIEVLPSSGYWMNKIDFTLIELIEKCTKRYRNHTGSNSEDSHWIKQGERKKDD